MRETWNNTIPNKNPVVSLSYDVQEKLGRFFLGGDAPIVPLPVQTGGFITIHVPAGPVNFEV